MLHRLSIATMLVGLGLVAVISPVTAGEEAKAGNSIDLKLTAELVQSWASRPSFPESVTFAYYNAYSLQALGKEIGPELKQRITQYVFRCQQENGGFTGEPTYSKSPNVIFTYYGLNTLAVLGAVEGIDRRGTLRFLRSLVQDDGGMAATDKPKARAALSATYYGVEALHLLGALDSLDKEKTAAFVRRYQVEDKGFSVMEGGGSSPQATHMAVRTLALLGALTPELQVDVIAYLKATRYSGLITDKRYRGLPGIKAMASTLDALSALGAIQEINADIGPRPGLGTTPPSTYHAIACLVRLGKLRDPLTGGAETSVPPRKPGTTTTPQ
jgi:hypothetical protein